MSALLDVVGQYLDSDSVQTISQSIGADPDQTRQAIGAALPTLLGAITRNAAQPEGEASLHRALSNDHDGSILDHLGGLFGTDAVESPAVTERTTAGGSILDHILGSRKSRVEEGVSRASGLSQSQVVQLMAMLAPLLMGALGKKRRQDDLSAGGLGDWLRGERKEVESTTFGGGLISKMFDQDGDGDVDLKDLMKFGAGRLFGK
ncbi:MAG: DUF937 domain-containing protein [Pirellulaceae bacterium]|nr:DUF937 domain-containing protein [Pirellulaceae bacterium]